MGLTKNPKFATSLQFLVCSILNSCRMSSTPRYADDPYAPGPPSSNNAGPLALPESENTPLLLVSRLLPRPFLGSTPETTPPQVEVEEVEVPVQPRSPTRLPRSRYRSREEFRWCTCCYIFTTCIIFFITQIALWNGLASLFSHNEFFLILLVLYIPIGFILWFFIGQIMVYRAILQELREFGPEEGIVTARILEEAER